MSEQANGSKNIFAHRPAKKVYFDILAESTDVIEGCCDIFMESTDTEEVISFPAEIDELQVISIGWCACQHCENVKKVIIPEGVRHIGSFAFSDCPKLEHIHLPSTLEHVRTSDLFYGNEVALITCNKDQPHAWRLDERALPPKRVVVTTAAQERGADEAGTVGIHTVWTYTSDLEVLYQRNFYLRVQPYPVERAEAALAEVKAAYELVRQTVQTYDVYSSDGVDPNDRDESVDLLDIKLENLVFGEDGACCGIFLKDMTFNGVLFFDGETVGTVAVGDRRLCYGHPLDYYIYTNRKLILRKSDHCFSASNIKPS